jgi:tRNA nucleotidyltransferase (CCA-adding enzyme)
MTCLPSAADIAAQVPAHALPVIRVLEGAGHRAALVGGGVRDLLLGRPAGDVDIATSAHPEEVLALFPGAIPTGIQHGTVTVLVDTGPGKRTPVEVTTFRADGTYTDGRRPDRVDFVADLRADLARRDFTVNALALRLFPEPALEDPFDGAGDLRDGVLRAVGDADARFTEDGLRAMRAARFVAVLGLTPAPGLEEAIRRALPVVARVAPERVLQEIQKLFEKAAQPSRGLRVMARTGLLELRFALAPQDEPSLARPDAVPMGLPQARWAAWLWDAGPRAAAQTVRSLRGSRALEEDVGVLCGALRPALAAGQGDAVIRRTVRAVGRRRVALLFALWSADGGGEVVARARRVLEEGYLESAAELALNGHQLRTLTAQEGPALGRLMRDLLARVDEDPGLNTPERLRDLLGSRL